MTERFLIDTCALIWFMESKPLSVDATVALVHCVDGSADGFVSSMSAWEVGMLISKNRLPTSMNASDWFENAINEVRCEVLYPTTKVLVNSSFLPQPIHNDPTDRILIATAREHDLTIITRDQSILDYGAAGHVKTLAC